MTTLTMKEEKRLEVIQRVFRGELTVVEAALVLGAFCVSTAFLFHLNFADHAERSLFLKDLAIAGGLLILGGLKPAVAPLSLAMLWRRRSAVPGDAVPR